MLLYSTNYINAGVEFQYFMLILSILIFFYIFFVKKHYARLFKKIRILLDADNDTSHLEKTIFRYAFIFNTLTLILYFIILKEFMNAPIGSPKYYILGVETILFFIISFGAFYYTTTKKYIITFRPKIGFKIENKSNDIKKLFSTEEQYISFINVLKENNYYYEFNNNMLFRAAVIRFANKKSFFKKIYNIKELKLLIEGGKHYIDQKSKINEVYSDEDLHFMNDITS